MPKENVGVSNKLTEAWALKSYFVEVNDCLIEESDYVDFECILGGGCIRASFSFLDNHGFMGQDKNAIEVGGLVQVEYTDVLGCETKLNFSINKITQDKDSKDQKLINFQMTDNISRNMKSTYKGKSYKDKKISEVLEEHLEETGNTEENMKHKIEVVGPEKESEKSIIIGSHAPFSGIFNHLLEENHYEYKTDRDTNYVVHKEHLGFDKLKETGETFEPDTDDISMSRILQYNIKGYDLNVLLDNVPEKNTSLDDSTMNEKDNKDGVEGKHEISKPECEDKEVCAPAKKVTSRGTKQTANPGDYKKIYSAISNAQSMSIWIPGRNINRVGMTVDVNFPRPIQYKNTEYDKEFSGSWEVVNVRDKVIGYYYVQELFLRRPGSKG